MRSSPGRGWRNVDYRLIPLDHPESEPERTAYVPIPAYVAAIGDAPDHSLGLIVVDGHYRTTCIHASLDKLAPGGYLLVDDLNMWPSLDSLPIPASWELADLSSNGLKQTGIWKARP